MLHTTAEWRLTMGLGGPAIRHTNRGSDHCAFSTLQYHLAIGAPTHPSDTQKINLSRPIWHLHCPLAHFSSQSDGSSDLCCPASHNIRGWPLEPFCPDLHKQTLSSLPRSKDTVTHLSSAQYFITYSDSMFDLSHLRCASSKAAWWPLLIRCLSSSGYAWREMT